MSHQRWAVVGVLGALLLVPPAARGDEATEAAKGLRSNVFAERLQALAALEKLGKGPAVEKAVLKALDDAEWEIQIRAAQVLATVGDDDARKALVQRVLHGEIRAVVDAATDALKALGAEAASASLLKLARISKDEVAQAQALHAVGRLGVAASEETLGDFLRSRNEGAIAAAAEALGMLPHDAAGAAHLLKALEPLLARRADRGAFAGYAAAIGVLAGLDLPAARRTLIREVLLQGDDDPYVMLRALRGLAIQPPADVGAALAEALEHADKPPAQRRLLHMAGDLRAALLRPALERLATSSQAGVRSEAARALGLVADPASATVLDTLLDDREVRVRVEAVTALGRCLPRDGFRALSARLRKNTQPDARVQYVVEVNDQGEPAGIPALAPFLDDSDWRVSSAAAAAVGTLGVALDARWLEPLAKDGRWQVRAAGFEGLGRLRAVRAIPLLIEGLSDKDPLVKGVCLANLQILTRQTLGAEPPKWRAWWEKFGTDLVLVKRSRRTPEEKAKEAKDRDQAYYHDDVERWNKRAIEVLQKARILVTIGAWDHVERVLDHLNIPRTLLRAQELKDTGLNPNQVLLVNCEGTQDKEGQERIRWFVNVGGYLMTTDWALINTLGPCFPGYLEKFQAASTGNDVVVVEETQPGHPWTQGIFERVPALMWWLEIQAFPIVVAYPERCQVLVDSAEMRRKYGSSPLAATFRYGLGKVQHSVSHFFLQEQGWAMHTQPHDRSIFAAEHLGVPLSEIRRLNEAKRLDGAITNDLMRELAPHYSMFRLIVNVVKEKEDWVEDL